MRYHTIRVMTESGTFDLRVSGETLVAMRHASKSREVWEPNPMEAFNRQMREAAEEARQAAEEFDRKLRDQQQRFREQERRKAEYDQMRFMFGDGTFTFDENFFQTFFEEAWTEETAPPKPPPQQPKTWTRDQSVRRLCELAKETYPTQLSVEKLYRRALRYCHPDTGGSHELFVELGSIKQRLKI